MAEGSSLLVTLVLLVPLALAARRQPEHGRRKPPASPGKRTSWSFPLLMVGLIVAAVGLTLGGHLLFRRLADTPALPSAVTRGGPGGSKPQKGPLPESVEDLLGDTWWADLTGVCPRLAAVDRAGAGQASSLLVKLVTVECLSQVCEHTEKLEAVPPSKLSRLRPMCGRLSSWMEERMERETWDYRFACPETFQAWTHRPWTPSNHLGFHKELRECLEPICMADEVSGTEAAVYCETAASIAEFTGDWQAVPLLRERARLVQERGDREMQGLSPEERKKAEVQRGLKATLRRWGEVCRKGMQQYCDAVAEYCQKEGHPLDVCPSPERSQATPDAGPR